MEDVRNKKNLILIFVLIFLVGVGFALSYYSGNNEVTNTDNNVIEKDKLLSNYSRFFTVNSCVYKFIQYLQKEDFDSLFKVLDQNYIASSGINTNNVYSLLPNLSDGVYNYVSKKIYYEDLSKNVVIYYVHGYIEKSVIDSLGTKEYYNYEVILDTKNETFSIAPYNGNLFRGEVSNG